MSHPNPARAAFAAALFCCALPAAADPVAGQIVIDGAWTRAVPEVSTTSAAFMTVRNTDRVDHRLVSVSSTAARAVELHDHTMIDGVMRMRRLADVGLPAGGEVSFAPGGRHLMLIGLIEPLAETGKAVRLQLEFEDGSRAAVIAPVRGPGNDRPARH